MVSQNVERERKIRILGKDLMNQIEFCDRLAEHPNHLIGIVIYLEREKQNLESFFVVDNTEKMEGQIAITWT